MSQNHQCEDKVIETASSPTHLAVLFVKSILYVFVVSENML